ncbi:heme peroxidase [Metarhizium brunneum]
MSPHGEHNGESATNGAQNGAHTNGAHTNGTQTNGTHTNGHDAREKGVSEKVVQPTETQKSGSKKTSSTGALMQLRRASRRPLPTEMGDGTYRNILRRPTLMQDLKSFGLGDLKTLRDIVKAKLKRETQQDDKTMIMERTIQLVSTMPNKSKRQEILTNSFIDTLWNSLDHPPLLYMGDEYKYRQPDGSNNNPLMPKLGAAGTPYSRTCKPGPANMGALPDPELIYEAVMARDGFKKNPNNVSSILWYWATIVIHDLFWTNSKDPNQNDSSSYLDLSPLYGKSKEDCDSIRTFKDGKLKPDTFADRRLIGNPPGVCILLIMFNRFHNHVVANLASINEGNRFAKPAAHLEGDALAAAWKKYDEDLFQTARLVTSGLYINITLVDYVRNIVNLNRVDTEWTLDPRQEMGVAVGTAKGAESGVGNVVSAEFNLCYRWHSCISEMDDKWIQDFYSQILGDNYGEMNLQTLIAAVKRYETTIPEEPSERTFGGFTRGSDGRFNDDELVDAISTAIEQPGGAFGAQNVPRIMKPVEILGIIRGRKWNLCGLNEFRKHFGLKAYDTFEDINSDPGVADALRNLYQHPDHVELYPGIVAEEGKAPMVPGVGIAPTYTISRVVLSDAVSLVRGDRHYTTDYHPGYLTQWGFNEANYNLEINHGCVFYKLFIRAFPNHFRYNSIYAHYPMVTPKENRMILTNLKRADRFDFGRPEFIAPPIQLTSYGAAQHVLTNQHKYKVMYREAFRFLVGSSGTKCMLAGDDPAHAEQRKVMHSLLYEDGWKASIKSFYAMITERLFAEKSYKIAGKAQVDVVRDIGNLAHTHFAARMFNLPLKSTENPKGVFSEQELYEALAMLFICIFSDLDPVKSFPLRQKAKEVTEQLVKAVEMNVKLTKSLGIRGLYTGPSPKSDDLSMYGVNLIKGLSKAGLGAHDIVCSHVLPVAGAMVPVQAQAFAQAVDWYLSPEGQEYIPELQRLAVAESSPENDALLLGYAMEGVRLASAFGLFREAAETETIKEDDGREVHVKAGDRVFVSLASAAREEAYFPEANKVNPRRPIDTYMHYGAGPHSCLGREVSQVALVEMFRALFRKRGLKRVPGPLGELKKIPQPGGLYLYMTENWGGVSPFPTSMKISWDE